MSGRRSTFERRHYTRIAEVIRRTRLLRHDSPEEAFGDLIEELCDHFATDNPNFQRATFRRFADPTRETGHV